MTDRSAVELAQLDEAFESALHDGELQLVTLCADAGLGKSRLLEEFSHRLRRRPDPPQLLIGRAARQTQSRPYGVLRNLVARQTGIRNHDPAAVVATKLVEGLTTLFSTPGEARLRAARLGPVLGFDQTVDNEPEAAANDQTELRQQALDDLRAVVAATAAQRATVILLEDLHWADDPSLDALNYLITQPQRTGALIIATARPHLWERRPEWGQGQLSHIRIDLRPLSRRASRQLVDEMLHRVIEVPPALHTLVVGHADGNPLYLEELVKVLIEDGTIDTTGEHWSVPEANLTTLRIPPTLTGLVQARLDSLTPDERTVVQQAAVVGPIFWDDVLRQIGTQGSGDTSAEATRTAPVDLDATLSALCRRELIFRRETSTVHQSREYVFKHQVVQQVAYESLLKKRRRQYHLEVANWWIARDDHRGGEQAAPIADHLERAGASQQAAPYLQRAGQRAASQYANAEALAYLDRALAATPTTDTSTCYDLRNTRQRVYALQGDYHAQQEDLELLDRLATTLVDPQRQAEVALGRAFCVGAQGNFSEAIAQASHAVELSLKAGETGAAARGQELWGRSLLYRGQFDAAQAHIEEARTLAEEAGLHEVQANSLRILAELGLRQGDLDNSQRLANQAQALYEEHGARQGHSLTLALLGELAYARGDRMTATTAHNQALQLAREIGYRWLEGRTLARLAFLALLDGTVDHARNLSEEGLQVADTLGAKDTRALTRSVQGRILAAQGDLIAAEQALAEALDLRRALEQPSLVAEVLTELAELARQQGDHDLARSRVETVLTSDEPLAPGELDPFRNMLLCARVLRQHDEAQARALLQHASDGLTQRAAHIADPAQRHAFWTELPTHRAIVDALADRREPSQPPAANSGLPS